MLLCYYLIQCGISLFIVCVFFYLFAGTEDEDEESNFMARVTHVGWMLEAHDSDVASRQSRQIASK